MVTTACIIDGQVESVGAALRALLVEAEKTGKATAVTPALAYITYLLHRVIAEVDLDGIERFDPEFAGLAADKFIETSRKIQMVIANSDRVGILERIPAKALFRKLQSQGGRLAQMADVLRNIDERWRAMLDAGTQFRLDALRREVASDQAGPAELFDFPEEAVEGPCEGALQEQLHCTVHSPRP